MVALIVRPLQPLVEAGFFADPMSSPRLVIIDGLDEISDCGARIKVLEVIHQALQWHHIPLIFLVCSRPEQDISQAFGMEPLSSITGRLLLDHKFNPDRDIQVYLEDKFTKLKDSHRHKNTLPSDWPPWHAIDKLVIKASGHFIYASTVVHFIELPHYRPADQLDIILGLRPISNNSPFSELDSLYMQILSVQKNWDQIQQILGVILASDGFIDTSNDIEEFLGLRIGDTELHLADMSSLVSWNSQRDHHIHILHASFRDFLLDPTRSGRFFVDEKGMHTMMAHHCLQHLIDAPKSHSTEGVFKSATSILLQ